MEKSFFLAEGRPTIGRHCQLHTVLHTLFVQYLSSHYYLFLRCHKVFLATFKNLLSHCRVPPHPTVAKLCKGVKSEGEDGYY